MAPTSAGPDPITGPKISLTMIAKNEEAHLRACLDSVAGLVHEVVVVDLGSDDRTKQIAAEFGARVLDDAWTDSFAAARNAGLRQATGDWIFCLEANQLLDAVNRERFRALAANLAVGNAAYSMKCVYPPNEQSQSSPVVDQVCLFRNDPRLEWRYRLYEQIMPALRSVGADVRFSDVVIHCSAAETEVRRRDPQRDLRLLNLENEDHPDDPFTLFNLGQIHHYEFGRSEVALSYWQRSLELSQPRDSIVRKLYVSIARAQRRLRQFDAALATCRAGLAQYPDDVELNLLASFEHQEVGDFKEAERCLLRAVESREHGH